MTDYSISEERLADYQAHRQSGHGLARTAVLLVFLSFIALIVFLPFIYMILISLTPAAEVGNGNFIPMALKQLPTLHNKNVLWLRAELTGDQPAALINLDTIPVIAAVNPLTSRQRFEALPDGVLYARRLGLEKPSPDSAQIDALIEVSDPAQSLIKAKHVFILYPGVPAGTWLAVEALITPRTLGTVLKRLVVNYAALLQWQKLTGGHVFAWLASGYPRWYINSLFVAMATVALGLFFDSLAGFAFAKFNFPFRKILFALLISTLLIPYPVTLVPVFFIFAKLGFYNTYAALIVPGLISAFGIFLVRQYIQHIPDDMLDAGRVDGASDFKLYRLIVLPTARPVIAALAIFRFLWQWNTYLYPLVLTNRDSMKTVQLGLASMQDAYGRVDYGLQMAGAVLAVIPILTVYAFMQKHFISGITLGSVKA